MSAVATVRSRALVLGLLGVLLAALVAVPWVASSLSVTVVTRMLILALFALAYNVVFGMAGMPALGHAAFFGAGGYVVGLSFLYTDWPFGVVLTAALLAGAVLGAVFGLLTLRTDGIYLLLITLALAQALWALAFQQVDLTRGDNGIAGISRTALPLVTTSSSFYWFTLGLTAVAGLMLWVFARSPVGRIIVGLRESATRMTALGYRVATYRVVAFIVSGAFSALAGFLFAYQNRFVSPEALSWPVSAEVMIFAILGGAATFFGPALGALLLVVLETWVSGFTARWLTVLGMVYVVTILFLPEGVLGLRRRLRLPRGAAS